VYDIAGRRIKTVLEATSAAAGDYRLMWNGADDAGDEAPAGSYLVRISIGGMSRNEKINLIR
jgi:flagellar hook assembly protein FlgD